MPVGVLTGGRLTLEDAYELHQVRPSRARHEQHRLPGAAALQRGGRLPRRTPWPAPARGVSFADLENASSVLLVCLEPEEEAGTIFLRLRKAFRKKHLASWTLAPYASNGARKMGAQLLPCVPGDEAKLLDRLYPEDAAAPEDPRTFPLMSIR